MFSESVTKVFGSLYYLYSNATKISATERNRSSIQSSYKPGTLKRAQTRCKTCSFIHDVQKYRNPSNPFTDQFTCTSANFIGYLTCTPGHYESDISNSIRLTYFDALISNKHSGQLLGKSKKSTHAVNLFQ